MQHTFLYQLYHYSKKGFIACVVFVVFYAFFWSKKMDMMLFPHNSMFATYVAEKKVFAYSLSVNNAIVPITQKAWWKKDMLESNASWYGQYYENGQQTLLGIFIDSKITDSSWNHFYRQRLSSGKIAPPDWAAFYTKLAGKKTKPGDEIALKKYIIAFSAGEAVITDSLTIFNFKQP